ncbi:tryptophan--tRNA ligase [Saccharopolyspora sp. CA-218241]|uniref:tryptophan--tRNA ligase n=1 Tax=Saccharopolyspora sp. CA-218241 TaxID=3240027 RepID=UPI003D99846D
MTTTAQQRSADLDTRLRAHPDRFRVLTGDRPTGRLHLGHYFGTLHNRVRLQRLGVPLHLVIADYQVITDRDTAEHLDEHVEELLLDYYAAGLDLERCTPFTHSAVPALNQLMLPLLSLVSLPELHRNPTVKDEITHSRQASVNGLMLTYPVHQAADILFCGANVVPVGQDQLPHLELTRTLARRFNDRYAPVFTEPEALLSPAPLVLGTDGTKMSKSRGNAIHLADTPDRTARLLRGATTDSQRHITYEPDTRPEIASLLLLASLCTGQDPHRIAEDLGSAGAAALKNTVTDAVNTHLAPLRARRAELAQDRTHLRRLLREGNARARDHAESTLDQVRTAMGTRY